MLRKFYKNKFVFIPSVVLGVLILAYVSFGLWQYTTTSSQFAASTTLYGINIGNQSVNDAKATVNTQLANSKVIITANDVTIEDTAANLGVYISDSQLSQALSAQRLNRLVNPLFYNKYTAPLVSIDELQFQKSTLPAIPQDKQPPKNASFVVAEDQVTIQDAVSGNSILLSDVAQNIVNIVFNPTNANGTIQTTLKQVTPVLNTEILSKLKDKAQAIYNNTYSLSDGTNNYEISKPRLITMLIPNSNYTELTLRESDSLILLEEAAAKANKPAVNEITTNYKSGKPQAVTTQGADGRNANNIGKIAQQLVTAVNQQTAFTSQLSFDTVPFQKKQITVDDTVRSVTYTYRIITWGNTKSSLDDFAAKVAQTLADGRGWAQAGVTFARVSGASNFDIVLSEPSELPARYPGTCDSTYSCRVGRYVIINDDRWRLATPSWNAAGGSLRDYQHMVVNHEVGHRLGRGHEFCSAAGQPAPVMQQQSISLQGCTFNPWPLPYEIAAVQRSNR
ncbi:MAG TPA: DUF3152 domain-containing protein [Candidatus Saccharibacteria bacterium]|nr:DUF3152 domain-containing protein [Candidatus Saccharibacteria bacterium]